MKKTKKTFSALLAAALTLGLAACGGKPAASSAPEPAQSQPSQPSASRSQPADASTEEQQPDASIEEWRAEQKIVVNGNTYQFLAKAMMSEEGDPLTVRLDSDVLLTDTAVILGTSDYGGLFNGMEMTIPSHNIVLDLNGHTLTAEKGCAVFEVQADYTLTVVDNSEAKTGRLSADGEAVIVEEGGAYIPPEG